MKKLAALFAFLPVLFAPTVVQAQEYGSARVVSTTSWVEEWDEASQSWVRVDDSEADWQAAPAPTITLTTHIVNGVIVSESETRGTSHNAARYALPLRPYERSEARVSYGPFRVLDERRAAIIGSTGLQSPEQFDAMLRDYPDLEVIEMLDASGTSHDIANLAVGRRIRAAGLRTHVPNGGSARSGGVELFLAGAERTMEPGAQFAVHSWLDNYGREPDDFAPDAPENRLYLDYYVEMGMSEDRAQGFYAMTNSVPHAGALWLRADDMQPWLAPEARPAVQHATVRFANRSMADHRLALDLHVLEHGRAPVLVPFIAYADLSEATVASLPVSKPLA